MKRWTKMAGVATAAGLVIAGIGFAAPANALGTITWPAFGCNSGYAGSSTYATSTGIGRAQTTKSGGNCTNIGVALRYDQGYGSVVNSVTKDQISTSRAVIISGGWHTDKNSTVTEHNS